MVIVNLKLGRNFMKGIVFGNHSLTADVEIIKDEKVEKHAKLFFIPENGTIEIDYDDKDNDARSLTGEERYALLEKILLEYCTIKNSLFRSTILLTIENYVFKDIIFEVSKDGEIRKVNENNDKTILQEVVSAKIPTQEELIFNLREIYTFIEEKTVMRNGKYVFKPARINQADIPLTMTMRGLQRNDIRYFTNTILSYYDLHKKWYADYDKKYNYMLIKKRTR